MRLFNSLIVAASIGVTGAFPVVFRFGSDHVSRRVPVISGTDAALNLADRLGVSQFYDLSELDDASSLEIGQEKSLDAHKQLVIVLNGVEDPEKFTEDLPVEPLFKVAETESLTSFLGELPEHLAKAHSDLKLQHLSDEIAFVSDVEDKSLASIWHDRFDKSLGREANALLSESWEYLKDTFFLNTVTEESDESRRNYKRSINLISDESFINEMSQLEFFFDKPHHAEVTVINLQSLVTILKKTGRDSTTYRVATHIVSDILARHSFGTSIDTTVVVLPPSAQVTASPVLAKREPVSPVVERDVDVIQSSGTCYSSQDVCLSATDKCSNHGLCEKVGKCYQCVCSATYNKKTKQTSNWAGFACEKLDYSVEFNLFLWTGLILVFLFVSGVKLLASCGQEELPGVLVAATVVKKSNA